LIYNFCPVFQGAKTRFGGRFSPLKYSIYELDLSFTDTNRYVEDQSYPIPSENVKSKENTLMVDADFSIEEVWSMEINWVLIRVHQKI